MELKTEDDSSIGKAAYFLSRPSLRERARGGGRAHLNQVSSTSSSWMRSPSVPKTALREHKSVSSREPRGGNRGKREGRESTWPSPSPPLSCGPPPISICPELRRGVERKGRSRGTKRGQGTKVVDGDAVTPPELSRDTPVVYVLQPAVPHLLKPLGHEPQLFAPGCLDGLGCHALRRSEAGRGSAGKRGLTSILMNHCSDNIGSITSPLR
jgi:hypothetical protein